MTTTYTVSGLEFLGNVQSNATAELTIVLDDSASSFSYNVLQFIPGEWPLVEINAPFVSISVDGATAGEGSPFSLDDIEVRVGFLNWSGGSTLVFEVSVPTVGGATTGWFPLAGPELPAFALSGFANLTSFLVSDIGNDLDALANLFTSATSPIGANQTISIDALQWDNVTNNPNGPVATVGSDTLDFTGEAEAQSIDGLGGNDTIIGGNGNDTLLGGFGFDSIDGGAGNDSIEGNNNADTLIGGSGNDTLIDDIGTDSLVGGIGNDRLLSGSGADRIDGGEGNDFIRAGSNFGSTVDGVNGGAGNDTIFGEGGFDLLIGGTGNDLIDGGAQADNIFGDAGEDTLLGGDGFDRLFGGTGNDSIEGQQGTDALFGSFGNDTLKGGDDRDRFFGGADNDLVFGDAGNDEVFGNGGFDTIDGGTGNDRLLGNFNADTFVFEDGHGNDTIADFEELNNFEKIDLSAIQGINSLADLNLASNSSGAAVQSGSSVVITTSAGNTIVLENVLLADLDGSDFIF